VRWKSTDVSEEYVAHIFGVEEKAEQETNVKAKCKQRFRAGLFLGLHFNPDDGDDMFLQNVCWLSTDYTALYPRREYGVEMSSRGMIHERRSMLIRSGTEVILWLLPQQF
jgi:hypothetical protein